MPLTEAESSVFRKDPYTKDEVNRMRKRAIDMTKILKSRRYKHTDVERLDDDELSRVADGGELQTTPDVIEPPMIAVETDPYDDDTDDDE